MQLPAVLSIFRVAYFNVEIKGNKPLCEYFISDLGRCHLLVREFSGQAKTYATTMWHEVIEMIWLWGYEKVDSEWQSIYFKDSTCLKFFPQWENKTFHIPCCSFCFLFFCKLWQSASCLWSGLFLKRLVASLKDK